MKKFSYSDFIHQYHELRQARDTYGKPTDMISLIAIVNSISEGTEVVEFYEELKSLNKEKYIELNLCIRWGEEKDIEIGGLKDE